MIVKFIFYLKVKIHIIIGQYEMRRVVISNVTLRIVIKSFERMILIGSKLISMSSWGKILISM